MLFGWLFLLLSVVLFLLLFGDLELLIFSLKLFYLLVILILLLRLCLLPLHFLGS